MHTGKEEAGAKISEVMAAREKRWDECGLEEKVERLRRQLMQQRNVAEAAYRTADEAKRVASEHQHGQYGSVMVPVYGGANLSRGGQLGGSSIDPLA